MVEVDKNGDVIADALTVNTSKTFSEATTETLDFGTIKYEEAGEHYYQITETTEAKTGDGWTMDNDVYTVTVKVTDNGKGNLEAEVTGGNIEIINSYKANPVIVDPTAAETLFGNKNLAVGVPGAPQTFNFTMTGADGAPMPDSATAQLTYAVGARGVQAIPFGTIEYTETGTFEYTISEANPGTGWTVTGNDAKVTVIITDNGVGQLVATIDGGAKTITNEYAPTLNFTAVKVWVGDDPAQRPDEISISLYAMMAGGEIEVPGYRYIGVTAGDGWSYTATNLPVYEVRPDGRMVRIQYYWREDGVPEGYEAGYADGAGGTTIFNTYNLIIIDDLETPLGLGDVYNNVGECFE